MGKHWIAFARACRTALTAAVIVCSPQLLHADQGRHHPSLVDPAITKCRVCHEYLKSDDHAGVDERNCLECHSFVKREMRTFVVLTEHLSAEASTEVSGSDEAGGWATNMPDTGASEHAAPVAATAGSSVPSHDPEPSPHGAPPCTDDFRSEPGR